MRDLLQLHDVLAVEQRRSLLKRPVLRLNYEEVTIDELERDPATVNDLEKKLIQMSECSPLGEMRSIRT